MTVPLSTAHNPLSPPAWEAWIEIDKSSLLEVARTSLPAREAWIGMKAHGNGNKDIQRAASVDALLGALMYQRLKEYYDKLGKEYSAEDFILRTQVEAGGALISADDIQVQNGGDLVVKGMKVHPDFVEGNRITGNVKGLLDKIAGILDSEEPQNAMALRSFIPADIADEFLNAMQENDIERAKKIVSDKAAAMEVFNQLNSDVNLDEKVPVIDISGSMEQAKSMSNKDVKQYVKNLIDEWEGDKTKDGDFFVKILPKDVNHITYSSMRHISKKTKIARKSSLLNLEDLARSAALIESVPNRKEDKKPNVKMYHKFFIPVYTGEKTIVMCLVTEEQKGNKSISPTEVNLYDVIPKRESLTAETGISPARQTGKTLSEISIRDMLSGVKGDDGKLYINADGSGNYAKILNQVSPEQNTLNNLYVNKNKAAKLFHTIGLQLPEGGKVNDLFGDSIKDENDLVKLRQENNFTLYQAAYHGSPYDFDRFDLGAIGTGEGAQAHGWGLYFAENRKIAEKYKKLYCTKAGCKIELNRLK